MTRGVPFRSAGAAGQATVELALALPVVVLALLAVVQTAVLVRDRVAVEHAAHAAARSASVERDPAAARAVAHRVLPGSEVDVDARPPVGEPIGVDVRYRSQTRLPLVGALFPDPEFHARAVMRVER